MRRFRQFLFYFFNLCSAPPSRFFRTVAETLDAMKYHDAGAFVQDVRLIFDNARKYNPPKHPIHVAASKLSKVGFVLGFVSSVFRRQQSMKWFNIECYGSTSCMRDGNRSHRHACLQKKIIRSNIISYVPGTFFLFFAFLITGMGANDLLTHYLSKEACFRCCAYSVLAVHGCA